MIHDESHWTVRNGSYTSKERWKKMPGKKGKGRQDKGHNKGHKREDWRAGRATRRWWGWGAEFFGFLWDKSTCPLRITLCFFSSGLQSLYPTDSSVFSQFPSDILPSFLCVDAAFQNAFLQCPRHPVWKCALCCHGFNVMALKNDSLVLV